MTYSICCQNLHSILPLGAWPPNPKHRTPKLMALHLAEHRCPCPTSFGTNPDPWLLKSEILRHSTIGRHSIRAEANVWDPPLTQKPISKCTTLQRSPPCDR